MNIRSAALIFSLAPIAVPAALAQQISTGTSVNTQADTTTLIFNPPKFSPQPVTGAPYTADRLSEHTQTLADGTHIRESRSTQRIFRDSRGRVRTEGPALPLMPLTGRLRAADVRIVEITDPVAGLAYVLDEQNKVAHRIALSERPATQAATGAPANSDRTPAPVSGVAGSGGGGSTARTQTADAMSPQRTNEKLEPKNIEGVIAEGRRMTTTWPIDSRGNDRPIVETSETWFSPELRETVLSTNSSPMNGESVMKLTSIIQAEPDPSLFQPPAGYTIVDEKDSFKITFKRP